MCVWLRYPYYTYSASSPYSSSLISSSIRRILLSRLHARTHAYSLLQTTPFPSCSIYPHHLPSFLSRRQLSNSLLGLRWTPQRACVYPCDQSVCSYRRCISSLQQSGSCLVCGESSTGYVQSCSRLHCLFKLPILYPPCCALLVRQVWQS